MAKLDFIAKLIENCLAPRRMKGMLTKTIKTDKLTGVSNSNKSDIPIAPPSKKPLGSKNPFNPILAIQIPMAMKRKSFQNGQEVMVLRKFVSVPMGCD